jgi:hypothetical protein
MIANLIAGHWCRPHTPALPVYNPATEDVLDEVPLSGPVEVAQHYLYSTTVALTSRQRSGHPPPQVISVFLVCANARCF